MGWFRRLSGDFKVRVEGEDIDGRSFTGKIPFEGHVESEEELIKIIVNTLLVEEGIKVDWVQIVGGSGYANSNLTISGNKFYVKREQ